MKKLNSMNAEMETSGQKGVCEKRTCSAFTLAEMMVVMLILSIVMAAFAPVMTTRSKSDRNSPWRYASDNSNIYYGLGENQTAMLGQPNKNINLDPSGRLLISTSNDAQNHIIFKRGADSLLGVLRVSKGGILLGSLNSGDLDTGIIGIGRNITLSGLGAISIGQSSTVSAENAVAIGKSTSAKNSGSIAIGNLAEATANQAVTIGAESDASEIFASAYGYHANASGKNSTAIGEYARAEADHATALHSTATGKSSTAIGYGTATNQFSLLLAPGKSTGSGDNKSESSGHSAIAIGGNSHATGSYSIGIGTGANSKKSSSLAIGTLATASEENTIAIGGSSSSGLGSIAIGDGAKASNDYDAAMGVNAQATGGQSISIGYYSVSDALNSIALGTSQAKGEAGIAIGNNALANGDNTVAIGMNACKNAVGANKICIGKDAGPAKDSEAAKNSDEMIYIGSKPKWGPRRGASWGRDAVLLVHNPNNGESYKGHQLGKKRGAMEWGPTVYINGNLVVRGYTYTVGRGDDNKESEPLGILGNKNGDTGGDQVKWYGDAEPGEFFSDIRLKYVGKEVTTGLDKVKQLKIFNYTFKKDEKKTPHVGVIAQDLEKIFPNSVIKDEKTGFLKIRTEDMFYALVNAVKELDTKIINLTEQLKIVQEQNKQIIKQNKAIEARLKALEASK